MNGPLWDKGVSKDDAMMQYTARDDWQLDQRLLPYDLQATLAHVNGLHRIGTLDDADHGSLVAALEQFRRRADCRDRVRHDGLGRYRRCQCVSV